MAENYREEMNRYREEFVRIALSEGVISEKQYCRALLYQRDRGEESKSGR